MCTFQLNSKVWTLSFPKDSTSKLINNLRQNLSAIPVHRSCEDLMQVGNYDKNEKRCKIPPNPNPLLWACKNCVIAYSPIIPKKNFIPNQEIPQAIKHKCQLQLELWNQEQIGPGIITMAEGRAKLGFTKKRKTYSGTGPVYLEVPASSFLLLSRQCRLRSNP